MGVTRKDLITRTKGCKGEKIKKRGPRKTGQKPRKGDLLEGKKRKEKAPSGPGKRRQVAGVEGGEERKESKRLGGPSPKGA